MPDCPKTVTVRFAGTSGPVIFDGCGHLAERLAAVTRSWPHRFLQRCPRDGVHVRLCADRHGITVTSPWLNPFKTFVDETEAVAEAVAQLFWLRAQKRTQELALHCAGVIIKGRLILIPATYQAGKSTLMAAACAQGMKVFGDDVIWYDLRDERARASGCLPRPRLPLPENAPGGLKAYVDDHSVYPGFYSTFVDPGAAHLAPYGSRARIGALVLLDRKESGPAKLDPAPPDKALEIMLLQNFSRQTAARSILKGLAAVLSKLRSYRLTYSDLGEAVALLEQVDTRANNDLKKPTGLEQPTGTRLQVGQSLFLSDDARQKIYQLNPLAHAILNLSEEGLTHEEIIALVQSAFPDTPIADIKRDVSQSLDLIRKLKQ